MAVRAGSLADSSLIARPLGSVRSYVVASPAFAKKHGSPRVPADLARLDAVVFGASPDRETWRLTSGDDTTAVTVRPRLVANDFDFVRAGALAGLGVAMLPDYLFQQDVAAKRLKRLLPGWCSVVVPFQAVYPSTRHLSPKVKAFVDHLRDALASALVSGEAS